MKRPKVELGTYASTDYYFDCKREQVRSYHYVRKGENVVRRRMLLSDFKSLDLHVVEIEEEGKTKQVGRLIKPNSQNQKKLERALLALHKAQEKELEEEQEKAERVGRISEYFKLWIETSDKATATVKYYRFVRDQYLQAVGDHPLYDVDERTRLRRYPLRHADKFKVWLKERGLSSASIHLRLRTLRTLLHWLAAEGRNEIDVVPRFDMPKKDKKIPKALNDAQIGQLFTLLAERQRKADPSKWWYLHLHERYLMAALGTGRRVGELHSRKWEHFNLDDGLLFVGDEADADFTVKDDEESWVVLPATLLQYLSDLRSRYPSEVWYLDSGKGQLAFKREALTRAFGRLIAAIGLRGQGYKATHNLRAGYITQMFKDGVDLETIRRSVGHSVLSTTQAYIAEPDALLKQAVKQYDKRMVKLAGRRHLRVV